MTHKSSLLISLGVLAAGCGDPGLQKDAYTLKFANVIGTTLTFQSPDNNSDPECYDSLVATEKTHGNMMGSGYGNSRLQAESDTVQDLNDGNASETLQVFTESSDTERYVPYLVTAKPLGKEIKNLIKNLEKGIREEKFTLMVDANNGLIQVNTEYGQSWDVYPDLGFLQIKNGKGKYTNFTHMKIAISNGIEIPLISDSVYDFWGFNEYSNTTIDMKERLLSYLNIMRKNCQLVIVPEYVAQGTEE